MAADTDGIILTSLNDCLIFLHWLNTEGKGKDMQLQVAEKLREHLAKYYNNPDQSKIASSLSTFLDHVDTFYKKLVYEHVPEQQFLSGASMSRDDKIKKPDILVKALLECIPKFLAAIYFLWYNVSNKFKAMGGAKWAELYPGAASTWWWRSSGGDLDKYLLERSGSSKYGGIIPGGFTKDEVRYGYDWDGYRYGFSMVGDLRKIFGKGDGQFFRDVCATSVLSNNSGAGKPNTANALALVNRFCEIVTEEAKKTNGGALKAKLDEEIMKKSKCSINWESLKHHCEHLQQQLGKIFKEGAFSFTGYGRESKDLKTTEFAQKTAEWLRNNLEVVRKHLAGIAPFTKRHDSFDMRVYPESAPPLQKYYEDLGPHFTKNLFPYGFTFDKADFKNQSAPYYTLRNDWETVIEKLRKDAEDGGLKKLKKLLDGEPCRPPAQPSGTVGATASGARGSQRVMQQHSGTSSGVRGNHRGRGRGIRGGAMTQRGRGHVHKPTGATGRPGAHRTQPADSGQHQPSKSKNSVQSHSQSPTSAAEPPPPKVPEIPKMPVPAEKVPVPAPRKEEAPPTTVPEAPKEVVPEKKGDSEPKSTEPLATRTEATKTEAAKPVATKTEATNTYAEPERTDEQGKKAEGAQDQGVVTNTSLNQNNGQSEEGPLPPTVAKDVASSSHSNTADAGPTGLPAVNGPERPTALVTQDSVGPQAQQTPRDPPSEAPPPSDTTGTDSVGESGERGADTGGSGSPNQVPAAPQASAQPPRTVQSADAEPSAASGTDSGKGDSQHSSQNGLSSTTTSDTAATIVSSSEGSGIGDGGASGSGGDARGGADGGSQDNLKTLQPSPQLPTTSDSISASTTSVGSGPPVSPDLTPISSPQENSHDQGADKSGKSTVTVSQNDASDLAGRAGAAGTPVQQTVDNQGNGSEGQSGPAPSVPPPPQAPLHSAPEPASPSLLGDPSAATRDNGISGQNPAISLSSVTSEPQTVSLSQPSSPGGHGAGGGTGAPGTKGDQGHPGPVTPQSSPHQGQTDPPSVQQEPSKGDASATSPTPISAPSSQPSNTDVGDQGLRDNAHSAQSHIISQGTAVSQLASVSGLVPSPSGSLGSDPTQLPNAQLGSQDNQQSAVDSQQSLSATTMTTSAVQSSGSGVSGGGGVGTSSMHGQIAASSKSAMLAQTSSSPSTGSAASGSHVSGGGQQVQNIPEIESEVVINRWEDVRDDQRANGDPLSDVDFERLRDPNGVNLGKNPLIGPQTFGKAHPQSGILSYYEKPEETSEKLSKSLGLHNTYEPLKPLDFTFTPYSEIAGDLYSPQCRNPWYIHNLSTDAASATRSPPPDSDHLASPKTVREMLYWLVGLNQHGYIRWVTEYVESLLKEYNTDAPQPQYAIDIAGDPTKLDATMVTQTLTEASLYAANVLYTVKYRDYYTVYNDFKFESEYSKFRYSSDPSALLCQLLDYVYACHHQVQFLKAQCARDKLSGGWMGCNFGQDVAADSPLQSFLTDAYDSMFKTHLFDPCNICLKSRIRMGFKHKDLPQPSQTGDTLFTILSPSCGDDDPLLTLASYLNCLTRQTPRTTGEIVSYFHHFGKSLYDAPLKTLSKLGSALCNPHDHCPDWDHLKESDVIEFGELQVSNSVSSKHDIDHAGTLSTLLGCESVTSNCPKLLSPITYRAYALYSPTFAHTYLSWAVYLADTLRESLDRLHYDFTRHGCSGNKSFHQCDKAMPLLYLHGLTPPEGMPASAVKCSDVITKLEGVVNGGPIANLITCMDGFLYRVRGPFIYSVIALWSAALLFFSHMMIYRLDILRIRSHLIRSTASHRIDVKALLTKGRKMLSLYGVDYFDDDPMLS